MSRERRTLDSTVTNGTKYYYKVAAVNSGRDQRSVERSFRDAAGQRAGRAYGFDRDAGPQAKSL